ncbi:MAG TPA: TIGR03118 family protein [Puia sp.]|jgi:uncharacterized protein (TIGR03118 family)
MNYFTPLSRRFRSGGACLFVIIVLAFAGGCHKMTIDKNDLRDFQQVNLVSNTSKYQPLLIDPSLQNAWGLFWAPTGIAWVNSQAGHVSELYNNIPAIPAKPRPAVLIPSPVDTMGGNPTGGVFNSTKGFALASKALSSFIFVGVDGILSAWTGTSGNKAEVIANNSKTSSYTGLTLAADGSRNLLYAANFGAGRIDVWDTTWAPVRMSFRDPAMPSGFSPFNIQVVGSWLYVTYAKVGSDGRDQAGAGLGFVDVFNTDGSFVRRFATRGSLNAPWGVTMAPGTFLEDNDMGNGDNNSGKDNHGGNGNSGSGSNNSGPGNNNGNNNGNNSGPGNLSNGRDQTSPVILVGNFGDGHINVYTLDGTYQGQLQSHNRTIVIDGLWALGFAPVTATTISQSWLFFTAGPDRETNGIFGYLSK